MDDYYFMLISKWNEIYNMLDDIYHFQGYMDCEEMLEEKFGIRYQINHNVVSPYRHRYAEKISKDIVYVRANFYVYAIVDSKKFTEFLLKYG